MTLRAQGRRPRARGAAAAARTDHGSDALRIGIDTGGTFTDLVALHGGRVRVHKLASTPDDPARAVLAGIAELRGAHDVDAVHGTTVGLNAILTGRLARTAFVGNDGFRDLIEIGRQAREELYDLAPKKPVLPVPRELRFTIDTRREADGRLSRPAAAQALRRLRDQVRRSGASSVAIGLLHSYAHPEDEAKVARALAGLGVELTCSGSLAPVVGEFERFSAAILNAAIAPVVGSYLERLSAGVRPGRIRLLSSSGGILALEKARREPARALFSGPAGGVVATRALAKALGRQRVTSFDMGGTSTDVCLVEPSTAPAESGRIAGLELPLPGFAVHTVGCGGGSIAWIDAGGALRVGPQSAGADPGPACYGRGSEPTITDAHMVLGHMGPDTLLSGAFLVDPDLSMRAVGKLARRLGLSVRATAEGILAIADTTMLRALLVITAERSVDPATVPLVAFGGAGGLHAATLASRLGMPWAVVPEHPGAFSALGLALAAESCERRLPVWQRLDAKRGARLVAAAAALAGEARGELAVGGIRAASVAVDALVRYAGQGAGLRVPFTRRLAADFRALHERTHGFTANAPLEVVELRAVAAAEPERLPGVRPPRRHARQAPKGVRKPPAGGAGLAIHARESLAAGPIRGPAVIEEFSGAVLIPESYCATAGSCGLLLASTGPNESLGES